jgi:PAS domain S-box-containing protein
VAAFRNSFFTANKNFMEPFLKLFRKPSQPKKGTLPDEEKRLEELYAYEILDSFPEQDFEELVELAAQVSGCPIATISFIDRHRQWFKSSKGLPEPQTPRDISFCTHTILQDGDMVVEDARKDKRFASNPNVTGGLKVVFYAGTPIYSTNGHKLGTVCVVDQKSRSLSQAQMTCLKIIARQVTHLLDLRLRTRLLQERSEKLLAENEKSFDAFFDNDTLPKWIYELETLKILQVNEAAQARYGFSKEEFLDLTVFDFRDDNEPVHIHELVQALNEGSSSVNFETVHKTKSGATFPVQVTLSNITYGGKAARMATMNDISEKEELRNRLQQGKKGTEAKMEAAYTAREEERVHIGKELHDNINQVLTSTKLYLEVAAGNPDMKDEMIRLSRENVSMAIKKIRTLSKCLITPTEEFNLLQSLEELINSYLLSQSFEIDLSGTGNIEELPADLKITVFRIIQEALNNISKHAEATTVSVDISYTNSLTISIIDNGKGFDPGTKTLGAGLQNIRNRVQFYNGKLEIGSSQNHGCRFFVQLPVIDPQV